MRLIEKIIILSLILGLSLGLLTFLTKDFIIKSVLVKNLAKDGKYIVSLESVSSNLKNGQLVIQNLVLNRTAEKLPKLKFKKALIDFDLLSLLTEHLHVTNVLVDDLQFNLELSNDKLTEKVKHFISKTLTKKSKEEEVITDTFSQYQLKIDKIGLNNTILMLEMNSQTAEVLVPNINVSELNFTGDRKTILKDLQKSLTDVLLAEANKHKTKLFTDTIGKSIVDKLKKIF